MDIEWLITMVIIGAAAGIIAGRIVNTFGKKPIAYIVNMVVGIVGAFIGPVIFSVFEVSISSGILASIIMSTIGAVVLLVILKYFIAGL